MSIRRHGSGYEWAKALLFGALLALGMFLVVPLTQLFIDRERQVERAREIDVVEPPPEPPQEREMDEPKTKERQPRLERAPQQAPKAPKLEQIDLALNPSAGSVLKGDFELGFPEVSAGLKAFELSEVDQNPRPIMKVDPEYPARLKWDGVDGAVTLKIVVGREGRVTDAKVVRSTHSAFSQACLRAIKQWRFEPGKRKGSAVATQLLVPFRFEQ